MNKKIFIFLLMLFWIKTTVFTQIQSGYANVNATSLYYEISGKGLPMVFIHGIFCDTRNWEKQVKHFAPKYKVICYDARGYGKSALPDTVNSYYQFEDLKNLLDYLKIDKAIIVGHSMGGVIAMDFALHNPDRVIALILSEGGCRIKEVWNSHPETLEELDRPWVKLRTEGIEAGQKAFLEMPMMQQSLKNKQAGNIIRTMTMESPGWKWQFSAKQTYYIPESTRLLKKLTMPTLLIYGEFSPPMYYKAMKMFSDFIPNSKLVQLKGTSHCLNLENPEDFNSIISTFLNDSQITN